MNNHRGLAIVIANSSYITYDNLAHCQRDGSDMANALKNLKFDVIEAFNNTRDDLNQKIYEFINSASGYQTVVMYYSGYAVQVDGNNYIVPVDFTATDNKTLLLSVGLVDIRPVIDFMEKSYSKNNIIIFDACRALPFASKAITSKGLVEINVNSGTFAAFSSAPGTVAEEPDKNARNSIFTECILADIAAPNMKIEDLFNLASYNVTRKTNGMQQPFIRSALKSKFCFKYMSKEEVDEEIYRSMRDSYSVDTLLNLHTYFRIPISDIMRVYLRIKSKRPGGTLYKTNEQFEASVLDAILNLKFYFKYYRWFYGEKPVVMGEFYHNPLEIALKPIIGKEIDVNFVVKPRSSEYGLIISGSTNLPKGTVLLITVKNTNISYSSQSMTKVDEKNQFESEPFGKNQHSLPNGDYDVTISMPASNTQPASVQEVIGYKGQNLIGDFVNKDIIFGKTVKYCTVITVNDEPTAVSSC